MRPRPTFCLTLTIPSGETSTVASSFRKNKNVLTQASRKRVGRLHDSVSMYHNTEIGRVENDPEFSVPTARKWTADTLKLVKVCNGVVGCVPEGRFRVAPGAERRVHARVVTRVRWCFGSPQVRGKGSGSVWIRGSGLVWVRGSGSVWTRGSGSGSHRWLSRAQLVGG